MTTPFVLGPHVRESKVTIPIRKVEETYEAVSMMIAKPAGASTLQPLGEPSFADSTIDQPHNAGTPVHSVSYIYFAYIAYV